MRGLYKALAACVRVALIVIVGLMTCETFARMWTDSTGSFSVEAEFVSFDGEAKTLQVRKQDGSVISIPLERLSKADQDYVRQQMAKALGQGTLVRRWTDNSGGHSVEAEYVDFVDGKVRLKRRSDGKVLDVPLETLSDADQEFVRTQTQKASDSRVPAEENSGVADDGKSDESHQEPGTRMTEKVGPADPSEDEAGGASEPPAQEDSARHPVEKDPGNAGYATKASDAGDGGLPRDDKTSVVKTCVVGGGGALLVFAILFWLWRRAKRTGPSEMKCVLLFKALNPDGSPLSKAPGMWPLPQQGHPGRWVRVVGKLKRAPGDVYLYRPDEVVTSIGPALWLAEARGEHVKVNSRDGGGVVYREVRLLKRVGQWNERNLRLFACDCAERVLPDFELVMPGRPEPRHAIEVARRFACDQAASDDLTSAARQAWTIENHLRDRYHHESFSSPQEEDGVRKAWEAVELIATAIDSESARGPADLAKGVTRDDEAHWQATRLIEIMGLDRMVLHGVSAVEDLPEAANEVPTGEVAEASDAERPQVFFKCLDGSRNRSWPLPKRDQPGKWVRSGVGDNAFSSDLQVRTVEALLDDLDSRLYVAEGRGAYTECIAGLGVFSETRLVRQVEAWNDKTLRIFACDCVAHVLEVYEQHCSGDTRVREAVDVSRCFAAGAATARELDAAHEVLKAASRSELNVTPGAVIGAALCAVGSPKGCNAEGAAKYARETREHVAYYKGSRGPNLMATKPKEAAWQRQRLIEIMGLEQIEAEAPASKAGESLPAGLILATEVADDSPTDRSPASAEAGSSIQEPVATECASEEIEATSAESSTDGNQKSSPVSQLREVAEFRLQDGGCTAIAFSLDGQTVAEGCTGQVVRVWDLQNRKLQRTLEGARAEVRCVACSPDGSLIACGYGKAFEMGEICVWDCRSGDLLWREAAPVDRFTQSHGRVKAVTFSPDGKTLASGGWGGALTLWDVQKGKILRTFYHKSDPQAVAFAPDGKTVVCGRGDDDPAHAVRVWNVRSGELMHTLTGHDGEITSVVFSPDGRTIASSSLVDSPVRLWDASAGSLRKAITSPRNESARHLTFSPDGRTLAGVTFADEVLLWDAGTGELKFSEHHEDVTTVGFLAGGKTIATESSDLLFRLWDV